MLALVLPLVGGANLELSGATTPRITFHDTTTHSTINAEVMAPAPGTLTVTTAASPGAAPVERLRIDAIGRIGVTQTNPTGALHIGNGAYCTAGFCDVLVKLQAYSTGNAVVQMLNSSGATQWSAGYRDDGAGSGSYKIVSGEHMDSSNNLVLTADGNVGIGTNTPTSRLHIAGGDVRVRLQTANTGDANIQFANQTNAVKWTVGYRDGSGDGVFGISRGASLDAERKFTISTAGNVGIGTPNPVHRLHVGGGSAYVNGVWTENLGQVENNVQSGSETPLIRIDVANPYFNGFTFEIHLSGGRDWSDVRALARSHDAPLNIWSRP